MKVSQVSALKSCLLNAVFPETKNPQAKPGRPSGLVKPILKKPSVSRFSKLKIPSLPCRTCGGFLRFGFWETPSSPLEVHGTTTCSHADPGAFPAWLTLSLSGRVTEAGQQAAWREALWKEGQCHGRRDGRSHIYHRHRHHHHHHHHHHHQPEPPWNLKLP